MGVLHVDLQKVLRAELFLADVAIDPGRVSGFNVDPVHLEHVSFHKILVA